MHPFPWMFDDREYILRNADPMIEPHEGLNQNHKDFRILELLFQL